MLASTISAFATLTLLTKNSFLDEIKKQYVITAKAKGLSERAVLYGHVFRNAMLIVIAGLSGGVHRRVLRRLADHRDDLLARRAGAAGFRGGGGRDYPVIFGTLYVFGLIGLAGRAAVGPDVCLVDPRIDFEKPGDLSMAVAESSDLAGRKPARSVAAEPAPLAQFHGATGAPTGR